MNGGDDRFSATGNLAALIGITVDGGAGNDTILGSNGADLLLGGDGNDFIDGQQGNDTAFLGAGDDMFQWDPGDGSDMVEGQDGSDTMLFNGSDGAEIFAVSANGGRVLFTRNLGNIVMDLNDVESIDLNALGGTDTLTVNDLSGTDVTEVNVNLAGTIGGTAGDGAADTVIVNGTNGDDIIDVVGAGTSVSVVGLRGPGQHHPVRGRQRLAWSINGLGGDDSITATTLPAGVIKLTIDGGAGDDIVLGSQGADVAARRRRQRLRRRRQRQRHRLPRRRRRRVPVGPGRRQRHDRRPGRHRHACCSSAPTSAENIDILANGGRVLFLRDVANVTMDLDDVERIDFRALGGADNIVVGDLSGTDVTQRRPRSAGRPAAATARPTPSPSTRRRATTCSASAGNAAVGVTCPACTTQVDILSAEAANDRLVLNGLGGDDVIDATSLAADGIQLTMNGGLGDDVFLGSEGDDLINGGDGNDIAFMGAGDDTFVWNPGDDNDTVEGQAGFDTMLFNGANVAENIDISANGGRVLFTRNVANVIMDLNDVETIDFNALGGADNIVVNDLSGTDVTEVNINLAAAGGAGDGAADTIIINATNGDDVDHRHRRWQRRRHDTGPRPPPVNITGFEAGNDRIIINGLAGDDVIEASGLGAGSIQLTGDGGAGNDVAHRRRRQRHAARRRRRRRADRRRRHRRARRRPRRRRRDPVAGSNGVQPAAAVRSLRVTGRSGIRSECRPSPATLGRK